MGWDKERLKMIGEGGVILPQLVSLAFKDCQINLLYFNLIITSL